MPKEVSSNRHPCHHISQGAMSHSLRKRPHPEGTLGHKNGWKCSCCWFHSCLHDSLAFIYPLVPSANEAFKTSADAKTLVSLTHVNMAIIRYPVLNADHNLPSAIFPLSLFTYICYAATILSHLKHRFKRSGGFELFFPPKLLIWGEDKWQEKLSSWAPQGTRLIC